MSGLSYITQHKRSDQLGKLTRHEFGILGFDGLSIVHVECGDGVTEETISLNGQCYYTLDEATSAWRAQRANLDLHNAVGSSLRKLFFGSEETQSWSSLPPNKRESWVEGARALIGHLDELGLKITKRD